MNAGLKMVYAPQHQRWVHQDKALAAINGSDVFALFMEMRTGKTKVILDEFGQDELDGVVDNLLVVAPAGVYHTWRTDAQKHLSEDLKQRVLIDAWESGPTPTELHRLNSFMRHAGPKIFLVNVEALSTVKQAREMCRLFLQRGPATMVIDESTTIKNPTAARTKFCIEIAPLAQKRRVLSGLPSPQSPLDVFSQFDFLGRGLLGYPKYTAFRNRYAVIQRKPYGPGGRLIDVVVGYQNLEELKESMRPYVYRIKLDECYDLPPKMYIRRDVALTLEQQAIYEEMKAFAVAQLNSVERVTATIALTQMLRLHQILSGHTMSDDGNIVDVPENKTEEMMAILENTSGKAIIWVAYDETVKRVVHVLENVYGKGSVARFWGGNRDTREDEEKQFKTNDACRFMVATASAGGRGRTWDIAKTVIYYANTFSLEHRMQSEERPQAVGKTESVGVFDLVARGSIEDKILDALRSKIKLSDAVTGDGWREWVV
jgi:hypothetical protein